MVWICYVYLNALGWELFQKDGGKFRLFMEKTIQLMLNQEVPIEQLCVYIQFMKFAFRVRCVVLHGI